MTNLIQLADTDEKILKCRKVVLDLRPHINTDDYLNTIKKMIADGYTMIFTEEDGEAISFAGFFTGFKLHRGNYLYIDDLNTLSGFRKRGYAGKILDWIFEYAKSKNLDQVHLDSGVQRFDAHRLYLNYGFIISSHHFMKKIND